MPARVSGGDSRGVTCWQFLTVPLSADVSVCQKSSGLHDWKKFPTVEN